MRIFRKIKMSALTVIAMLVALACSTSMAWADDVTMSFGVSPMKQTIVLNPGDTYHGSFKVINPNDSTEDIEYEIERKSFYVDDDYGTTFDKDNTPIVGWTTMDSPTVGTLRPNSVNEIMFTIDVPADAMPGGQYEAFLVKTKSAEVEEGRITGATGATINEQFSIAHLVFAEVAGDLTRKGEVEDISVPSFLFSGNITGAAAIRNTGNIHGKAKYTMQVYPLFSDEEIYTNEEDPDERIILPDRVLYNKIAWKETPMMGIFNVVFTVEFEGVTAQVKKMVVVCPLWLLFLILFLIFLVITWFFTRSKSRKGSKKSKSEEQ